MTPETFIEHFETFAEAPNGIAKLRELILQLAVQGKLVPQDENDEPADVLIEKLASSLLTRGNDSTSKRRDAQASMSSEDLSFALPSGWAWTRLGVIGETNIGLTYSPDEVSDIGVPVLRSNNIQKGRIDLSDLVRVNANLKPSVLVEKGDLLICARNGSRALVGKTAIIQQLEEPMAFGAFMAIFRCPLNRYLYHFICSPIFRNLISGVNTTTINQITQSHLRSIRVPVPPLAEQRRIVEKVEQLLSLCDELEARQATRRESRSALVGATLNRLVSAGSSAELPVHAHRLRDHFDRLFDTPSTIPQLRQTILQLAVQGQLVPQDPNDEPADLLLAKIHQRRRELVTEGKLAATAKPVPLAEGDAEGIIPEHWRWTRLNDLVSVMDSGWSPPAMENRRPKNLSGACSRQRRSKRSSSIRQHTSDCPPASSLDQRLKPKPETSS